MSADALCRLPAKVLGEGGLSDQSIRRRLARITALDKWMIVAGMSIAAALELGTQVGVNVILTDMKGNVAASQDEISWVVVAYGAAFLSVLPLTVWFVRRLGHRNFLVLSLLLYGAGAFGCFVSGTLPELLLARIVMGLGGGAFLVRALTVLFRLFTPRERAGAFPIFGLVVSASRAFTPVWFGLVTDQRGWNYAFLTIVPVTLVAAGLLYFSIPERLEIDPPPAPVDVFGTALVVAGLAGFQIAMSRGEQDMWLESGLIRSMLLLAVVCLALFAWWDTRRQNANPLLNLRLLRREPGLASGLAIAMTLGALLAAGLFVLPLYLRGIEGYSATQTSLFFCADAIATYAGILFGARYAPRLSAQVVVLFGLTLFAAANYLLTILLTPDTPALPLCLTLVLHGISIGMLLPGVTFLIVGRSSLRYLSFDMAIYFLFRSLGSVTGVGGVVALLDIRETVHSSRLLDVGNRLNPSVQRVLAGLVQLLHAKGFAPNVAGLGARQIFQGLVIRQTATLAFIDVFWCFQWVAIAGMFFVLLTWHRGVASRPAPRNLPR